MVNVMSDILQPTGSHLVDGITGCFPVTHAKGMTSDGPFRMLERPLHGLGSQRVHAFQSVERIDGTFGF